MQHRKSFRKLLSMVTEQSRTMEAATLLTWPRCARIGAGPKFKPMVLMDETLYIKIFQCPTHAKSEHLTKLAN